MTVPPTDRLKIFVSSAIEECAEERAVVSGAIEAINHEPVLFERIGARPHPPPDLYRPRLKTAHIFVGIYRESYGWVAPDMTISGVEDEFTIASRRGMDRLIYVLRDAPARQPRLQELIDRAKADLTIAFYDEPEDLQDRVRHDVTAVVSNRFVDQPLSFSDVASAAEVLESLFSASSQAFRRKAVEKDLLAALESTERLCVTAPMGGGKTVLLAQLSALRDWLFVDARGMTEFDVIASIANCLRERQGKPSRTFSNEAAATTELLAAWRAFAGNTLVVDGARIPQAVWNLMPPGAYLLVSASQSIAAPNATHFRIPPLQAEEIRAWVTELRGEATSAEEVNRLARQSKGSPLYLRFYALGEPHREHLSLQQLEIDTFEALSPRAREVVVYLSLASRPLDLAALTTLVATTTSDGPEAVASVVNEAGAFVVDIGGGISLVNEHTRRTLGEHLRESPARHSFFARRLGAYYATRGQYLWAFTVFDDAGERSRADDVLPRAAYQAGMRGGGVSAVSVFRRQVQVASELAHGPDEVVARISLAQALQQIGDLGGAEEQIEQARTRAHAVDDHRVTLVVREAELTLRIGTMSVEERLLAIASLCDDYAENGNEFEAARTATALAESYIQAGMFEEAEARSRSALNYFVAVGDRYGQRVARTNLAVSLSGLEGREDEAASLAQTLVKEIDPSRHPRERAVICNIMTRRFRRSGNPEMARRYAREAIEIGETLGLHRVVAVNRINLGNIERDEGSLDAALGEYRAADRAAHQAGDSNTEAFANFDIASVLNERREHTLAAFYAQHAVAKAREAHNPLIQVRANKELAIAHRGEQNIPDAIDAYIAAFIAAPHHPTSKTWQLDLACTALALAAEADRADLTVHALAELFEDDPAPATDDLATDMLRSFYAGLRPMVTSARSELILPLVALALSGVLVDLPTPVERRILLQSAEAVLSTATDRESATLLLAIAGLVLASNWDALSLPDLVDLAEAIVEVDSRVHFKPQPDGAGHWNVRIGPDPAVLVTLTQMDTSNRSAVVALAIACLLAAVGDRFCDEIIGTAQRPRDEATIMVTCRSEFETQIEPTAVRLGTMERGFGILRPVEPSLPFFIVYEDGFGTRWQPARHSISDLHQLFAEVLYALASHLLGEHLEPEVIDPKVDGLMQRLLWKRGQY